MKPIASSQPSPRSTPDNSPRFQPWFPAHLVHTSPEGITVGGGEQAPSPALAVSGDGKTSTISMKL